MSIVSVTAGTKTIQGISTTDGLSGIFTFEKQSAVFGTQAGSKINYNNTVTEHNILFGHQVVNNATIAARNTVIGWQAGFLQPTSIDNILIGYQVARQQYGQRVLMIGNQAGYNANAFSSNNLFLGHLSGYALTNGTENCFLGTDSGKDLNQGSYNTCVGCSSGPDASTLATKGSYNTSLGYKSKCGGGDSIVIGANTKNQGALSTIIGNSVENTGNRCFLCVPNNAEAPVYVNTRDDVLNVHNILLGECNESLQTYDVTLRGDRLLISGRTTMCNDLVLSGEVTFSNGIQVVGGNTRFINTDMVVTGTGGLTLQDSDLVLSGTSRPTFNNGISVLGSNATTFINSDLFMIGSSRPIFQNGISAFGTTPTTFSNNSVVLVGTSHATLSNGLTVTGARGVTLTNTNLVLTGTTATLSNGVTVTGAPTTLINSDLILTSSHATFSNGATFAGPFPVVIEHADLELRGSSRATFSNGAVFTGSTGTLFSDTDLVLAGSSHATFSNGATFTGLLPTTLENTNLILSGTSRGTFSNGATFTGSTTVFENADLHLYGTSRATLCNGLTVVGPSPAVLMDTDLQLTGTSSATLCNTLLVAGTATFLGDVVGNFKGTFQGNVETTQTDADNLVVNSNLSVKGLGSFHSNVSVLGILEANTLSNTNPIDIYSSHARIFGGDLSLMNGSLVSSTLSNTGSLDVYGASLNLRGGDVHIPDGRLLAHAISNVSSISGSNTLSIHAPQTKINGGPLTTDVVVTQTLSNLAGTAELEIFPGADGARIHGKLTLTSDPSVFNPTARAGYICELSNDPGLSIQTPDGHIVIMTGSFADSTSNIPVVAYSHANEQKSVFGVIQSSCNVALGFVHYNIPLTNPYVWVQTRGVGKIWLSDINTDPMNPGLLDALEVGDLLTTSGILPGMAVKQLGTSCTNSTVAKLCEPIDFATITEYTDASSNYKKYLASCVYLCG